MWNGLKTWNFSSKIQIEIKYEKSNEFMIKEIIIWPFVKPFNL